MNKEVRRLIMGALVLVLMSACASPTSPSPSSSPSRTPAVVDVRPFQALERRFGARLGVHAIDTGTGRTVAYRADERFAHASTFKALLAGVLLRRLSDAELRRVVKYSRADLLEWAPVTSRHVATGMRVDALIAATVQHSDNTAANLLLELVDGPKGLQEELREIDDKTTDLSRNEPALNTAVPGDRRDTSTPRALGADLRQFVLGEVLPAPRRQKMVDLLLGNTTGDAYIRAGVPSGWTVGDKTGSGGYGTRNDIAVVWPPTGDPLVVAIQSDRGEPDASSDDALIAEATKIVVSGLRR
ncbi:class A beta-lactamase [Actinoplanes sp. TRM 88003]|uniref:Class A beta-lactamase n=1 Tax=Paractinoplanes aksuensis TaxID=2939490 RepID=A0ABT1DZE7_9ACTN|nr:class A beta-lactamase [Actinoplanes aksuensis]MCO8276229.1 class A beta-lactamase [Actinoplanes aksuensis]